MTQWLVVYARKDGPMQREVVEAESLKAVVLALSGENEQPIVQIAVEPLDPAGRMFTF